MRATELTLRRSFALAFDDGDDFVKELTGFCAEQGIRQAIIPMFLGGFRWVRLVGTTGPLDDPEAPVWDETVLETVEAVGAGTLAWSPDADALAPHLHVAVGRKDLKAAGSVSHLVGAEVQFIQEMALQEVVSPLMLRPECGPHSVPTLTFEAPSLTIPLS
ncbi:MULTISPECIES: PPC domain-containing DNA-binding protein [unclassified Streptomyces]|uniref:PPC domain-containing DNA-binding protein n=1 Tax=unclassified Streptomyces TaxID=2593676 RepID=UPI001C2E31AA|nr:MULTISPECIES: PPC domain-containing DNA-binding protein [unclassified Streptomyces]MBV1949121.1 DNA-binding protein [Streptomyces sp. BV129]